MAKQFEARDANPIVVFTVDVFVGGCIAFVNHVHARDVGLGQSRPARNAVVVIPMRSWLPILPSDERNSTKIRLSFQMR